MNSKYNLRKNNNSMDINRLLVKQQQYSKLFSK